MSDLEPDAPTTTRISPSEEALLGRMVFDSLHDGVLLHGDRARVAAANPAAARLLGLDQADLVGGEPFVGRLVRPDGSVLDAEDCPVRRALATGRPQLGVLLSLVDDDGDQHVQPDRRDGDGRDGDGRDGDGRDGDGRDGDWRDRGRDGRDERDRDGDGRGRGDRAARGGGDEVVRWMELNVRPLSHEGTNFAAVTSIRDVTNDRLLEQELRNAARRQRLVLEHAVGGYVIIGEEGEVLDGSTSLLSWWHDRQAASMSIGYKSLHPDDRVTAWRLVEEAKRRPGVPRRIELRATDDEGGDRWIELTATDQRHEPAARGVIINFSDITERKLAEETSVFQATHDHITELPNRWLLGEQLDELLAAAEVEGGAGVAVIFFDVDHFKVVNDSRGHAAGDEVLKELARRFLRVVRSSDRIARFGGDEFVVICRSVTIDEAVAVTERFIEAAAQPFEVDGVEQSITISAGLAMSMPGDSAESLLRDADTALNTAKERGRARLVVFDDGLRDETTRRLAIQTGLEGVTRRDELSLVYQPVMSLRSGTAIGCEALLRWCHPRLGSIGPNDFIPVAERSRAIIELGRWVALAAIDQLAAWQAAGVAERFFMAINVSARQLVDPTFVPTVGDAVAAAGIDPGLLHLEVTESALMEDVAGVVGRLDQLKAIGVGLSIDDFGTGYSSMSYLKRLPIDTLKIDRSFVDGLGSDPHDTSIARAIVSLADALELAVIAEGVETETQAAELRSLGCDRAQGFLWHRPLPADELWEHLRSNPT